jgi:hypothetical protein
MLLEDRYPLPIEPGDPGHRLVAVVFFAAKFTRDSQK